MGEAYLQFHNAHFTAITSNLIGITRSWHAVEMESVDDPTKALCFPRDATWAGRTVCAFGYPGNHHDNHEG